MAEYALRDVGKPLGISEYRVQEMLPEAYRGTLPTIAELEAGLAAVAQDREDQDREDQAAGVNPDEDTTADGADREA